MLLDDLHCTTIASMISFLSVFLMSSWMTGSRQRLIKCSIWRRWFIAVYWFEADRIITDSVIDNRQCPHTDLGIGVILAGFTYGYIQGDQPEKVKKSVTYPKAGGPGGEAPGKILRFSPYIIMIGNFSNHLWLMEAVPHAFYCFEPTTMIIVSNWLVWAIFLIYY